MFLLRRDNTAAPYRPENCRERLTGSGAPPHHRSIAGAARPARHALSDERKVIERWAKAGGVMLRD
ncbi:hypothetical protein [Mesorhizobium opportunistum]|uniref:Uncharacterized protein n=1 Tax=Mesorhizobium opportunistum (strain LMG 24607 / HAMBI 3007 / WSM2075) TaxID=536019 RepID=F7YH51_MESOW|nr:hypothetical protein [Mesorhizobium opportunistum]AEH88073.1 hypothetical protein Mesop_3631 [Mesorhizobium opportunistum WSM2075]